MKPQKPNSTQISKHTIFPNSVVEYEQHGRPLLALAQEEKNGKWFLLNEEGEEASLGSNRLYLFGENSFENNKNGLKKLSSLIKDTVVKINVEDLWNHDGSSQKNLSLDELFILSALEDTPLNKIALRRALISDRTFFKREKEGFVRKTVEEVERSKSVKAENLNLESEKLALRLALQKKIMGDKKAILPEAVRNIEEIASGTRNSSLIKLYQSLIEDLCRIAGIKTGKHTPLDQKAFSLLLHVGHFTEHQNLVPLRIGRPLDFSSEERNEAEKLFQEYKKEILTDRTDLTSLDIFTIDSETSSDFDDALSIERIGSQYRVGVHITDVSHRIGKNSPLERAAFRRATSIYCPDETIPMLPQSLSEGVLSLKVDANKPSMSFFFTLDEEFNIKSREIISSNIVVKERLSYEAVDKILCDDVAHARKDDLLLLWDISSFHETSRIENGSLQFSRRDLVPNISKSGKVSLVANNDETPARKLVSELMIIANNTAAKFASENNIPFAYRSQEPPEVVIEKEIEKVPDGPAREFFKRSCLKRSKTSVHPAPHSGLGIDAYCQVTSPIRRALDLVLQRQLMHFILHGTALYTHEEIEKIITDLSVGLDEANLVQRERNRYWLLRYITQQKIQSFEGTIVRAEAPRPLAEIEILGATLLFTPYEPLEEGKNHSALLGKVVELSIKKLDHFQNKLYLQEVVSSR